jgi:hypothetical protein
MTRAGELLGRLAVPASSLQTSRGLDDLADEIERPGMLDGTLVGIPRAAIPADTSMTVGPEFAGPKPTSALRVSRDPATRCTLHPSFPLFVTDLL